MDVNYGNYQNNGNNVQYDQYGNAQYANRQAAQDCACADDDEECDCSQNRYTYGAYQEEEEELFGAAAPDASPTTVNT